MQDIQMEEEDLSLVSVENKPSLTYERNKTEENVLKESDTTIFTETSNNTTDRDESVSDKDVYNKEKTDDTANDNPLLAVKDSLPEGLINENGEINWDCPCLEGMADGPCGEQFKHSFSCFNYSNEDPRGVDCIEQFKAMQACMIQFPEIYRDFNEDSIEDQKVEENSSKERDSEKVVSKENAGGRSKESATTPDETTEVENVIQKIENDSSL